MRDAGMGQGAQMAALGAVAAGEGQALASIKIRNDKVRTLFNLTPDIE